MKLPTTKYHSCRAARSFSLPDRTRKMFCDRKEGLPELIRVHYPEDDVQVGERFKVIISKRGAADCLLY